MVFLASVGATMSFYLLLSVVPLYATSAGTGGVGAGLTTGALMAATVAAELATPRLVARFGYRWVFAIGLLLLGAPAFALTGSADLAVIVAVCLVRGLGFAIAVVVGSALVALLVPRQRRSEGLGLYGVSVGVPSIVALPLGVWLIDHVGYPPVFIAAAVFALVGVAAVTDLPGRGPIGSPAGEPAAVPDGEPATTAGRQPVPAAPVGVWSGLRTAALVRPSIAFCTVAMAAGAVVTFLPLALTDASGNLAALALLAQAAAATATRWWAGRHGDRHGSAGLLIPAMLTAAAGMLGLLLIDNPAAVLVGMVLFGAGFGVTQNASLALMFERVSRSGYGTVSAMWNLAYDAGLGIGGAGFGVVAAQAGYPHSFALTAAVIVAACGLAWRDRHVSATTVGDGRTGHKIR